MLIYLIVQFIVRPLFLVFKSKKIIPRSKGVACPWLRSTCKVPPERQMYAPLVTTLDKVLKNDIF